MPLWEAFWDFSCHRIVNEPPNSVCWTLPPRIIVSGSLNLMAQKVVFRFEDPRPG